MRNMNKLSMFAIAGVALLASCSKEKATVRELNGDWNVKTMTVDGTTLSQSALSTAPTLYKNTETKSTYSLSDGNFTRTEDKTSYSALATKQTSAPQETTTGTTTIKVSFDKKTGKYTWTEETNATKVITTTTIHLDSTYSIKTSSWVIANTTTTTTTSTKIDNYTRNEEGTFYLNEKAGDTKAGTRLVLTTSSNIQKGTLTTSSATVTTYSNSSYGTTSTSTPNTTVIPYTTTYKRDGASDNQVYNIVEATKKILKVEYVGSYTAKSDQTITSSGFLSYSSSLYTVTETSKIELGR